MAGLKKKVDLMCGRSFRIGPTLFTGNFSNIILDAEAIRIALSNKAVVKEVLKNGKRTPLDLSNYAVRNPLGCNVDDVQVENGDQPVYNVKTIKIGPSAIAANQPPVDFQVGQVTVNQKKIFEKPIEIKAPEKKVEPPVVTQKPVEESKPAEQPKEQSQSNNKQNENNKNDKKK